MEKVENGSHLVESAGASMDSIVSQVRTVSEFITEISSTAKEQVSAISQITDAVGQLDLVTQQNASLVEKRCHDGEKTSLISHNYLPG
ncbi:hypothetical protein OS42_26620 [Dickeya oryzae]